MVYSALLCLLFFCLVLGEKPNTCKTFEDYRYIDNNPNCWFNPDVHFDSKDFAMKYGYPFESYRVVTKDGYILNLFRLPQKESAKGIAYLTHPALMCSSVWLDKGNLSLGFQLYDEGYDVWLPNGRGNKYSRKHLTLKPSDPKFWDYTVHEMTLYDMAAQLEVVQNVTKARKNIAIIGHSLGGTQGILYPIFYPKEAEKLIKVVVSASPGTQFKYTSMPFITLLALSGRFSLSVARMFNLLELLNPIYKTILESVCVNNYAIQFCANMVYWMLGPTFSTQMMPEWFPILFSQQPAGISSKVFIHFFLNRRDGGRFQPFDYGAEENFKLYNSTLPPLYPVESVNIPIYFISGDKDIMVTARDTEEIYERLNQKANIYGHYVFENFNHVDFLYGKEINKFHRHVVDFLNKVYLQDENLNKP